MTLYQIGESLHSERKTTSSDEDLEESESESSPFVEKFQVHEVNPSDHDKIDRGSLSAYSNRRLLYIFTAGLGLQLGANTLLGAVGYLTVLHGEDSFLWMNVSIFFPLLPVSLLASRFRFAPYFKGKWLHTNEILSSPWTVLGSFLSCAILLSTTHLVVHSMRYLLFLSLLLGFFTAFQYSALFMIVMQVQSDGWFEMGLSFGFQASCFLTLLSKELSNLQPTSNLLTLKSYMRLSAVMMICTSWGIYKFCASFTPEDLRAQMGALENNETELSELSKFYSLEKEESNSPTSKRNGDEKENKWKKSLLVWRSVWPCAISIFLTAFGSLLLFPFYSYVPSASSNLNAKAEFAVKLFYAKSISDTLSRPSTVMIRFFRSQYALFLCSALRVVVCVPYFFVYSFAPGFCWIDDRFFLAFICFFSATSGLFITCGYQLAAEGNRNSSESTIVSSLLNGCFQLGAFSALVVVVLIRAILQL